MKSFLHTCPLIALTILFSLIVAGSMGMRRLLPAQASSGNDAMPASNAPLPSSSSLSSPPPSSTVPVSSALPRASSTSSEKSVSAARSSSSKPPQKKAAPSPAPPPKSPLFRAVGQDYFSDALFVGDSLTEDLKKYGGLDNASYFCHVGLSIYQLFEDPKPNALTGLTLDRTLRDGRYRKVYIMLGINEMGTGSTAYFVRHYSAALAKIRSLQPHAILYVESILPVTAEKSEKDSVFNNPNIRARNAGLQTLANGKNIFYLDIASAIADRDGSLPREDSGDGVHLKAKYDALWKNRLLENAVPYENAIFS
jgi:hypothetical protein